MLLAVGLGHVVAGKYSWLVGGVPRSGAPAHTFEALVRELGFGLFPWSAVAVFALARPLIRLDADGSAGPRGNRRLAFVELYLLLFAGMGFALSSYRDIVLGRPATRRCPAIALAIGAFLDEALEGLRPEPVAGLLMATGTMVVARDFFLSPEDLARSTCSTRSTGRRTIAVGNLILLVGLLGRAGRLRWSGGAPARARHVAGARNADRRTIPTGHRRAPSPSSAATGCRGRSSARCSSRSTCRRLIVPALSTHLSFKPVLESYAKFAKHGEKIGRTASRGTARPSTARRPWSICPPRIAWSPFLRDPQRVFALVAADELAPLDSAFKQAQVPYYVVDASSSRFLLLTNQLEPGQRDRTR